MVIKLPSDAGTNNIPQLPPGILDSSRRKIWNPLAKDWAIFEKYGRETAGAYTLLTVSVAPGGQNMPHWHGSYAETFTAEKGEVGIYRQSTGKMMLAPGESATVPAREVHYFFNPGDGDVVMKVELRPAPEGFEKGLYILYGLARDGESGDCGVPNSWMHAAVVSCLSDMWPPGWRGAVRVEDPGGLGEDEWFGRAFGATLLGLSHGGDVGDYSVGIRGSKTSSSFRAPVVSVLSHEFINRSYFSSQEWKDFDDG